MKSVSVLVFVVLAVAFFNSANSYPWPQDVPEDEVAQFYPFEVYNEEPAVEQHFRQKRATCDLASAWGVSHTLCAANCLRLGKKGGYCNSQQVCVCRN
uniref:Putative defensin isoform a1 n=1 Tax=Corethrella appendiculata TaxID=1370023 RepID=U5EZQ3_9DIPT